MSALYPLSPLMAAVPTTTLEMQRSLYQLTTLSHFEGTQPLLEGIHGLISSLPDTERGRLRRLPALLSGNPSETAQALCEVADIKKGDGPLKAITNSPLKEKISAATAPIGIETREVRDGVESWIASVPVSPTPHPSFSIGRTWGNINYWTGLPSAGALMAGGITGLGMEIANMVTAAQLHPGHLSALGTILGAASYLLWQRGHASNALTAHAERGTIEHEHVQEFFDRYRGPFPFQKVDVERLTPNRDILDDIRRSTGPGGAMKISKATTRRLMHDFVTLGQVTNKSFAKDPSQVLYDRLAQAIGMGTLENLGWQPIILHPERLADLRERQRRGRKLIFVGNHRSHLDILALVALFRDFRVRFPAKSDLLKIPVLKGLLLGANHPIINRGDTQGRYKDLLRQGKPLLEKGLSLYIFAEGTRAPTRVRSEEVGLLPFELGAFGLALQFQQGVDIIPICNYGLGRALPGEDKQAWEEGTMQNPPVVISIGEPIEIEQFTKGSKATTQAKVDLGNLAWSRMWKELAAIQALMNNGPRE